ncbi:MAG: ankyrin repeat domain-containing protein [Proteobacteria bacterium]|nr:ankyrin repeat domain-containing protein [Pseudomonadota bacterium]
MLFCKKSQAELNGALLNAVGMHKFAKAKELLAEGASLDARDEEGNTALHKLADYCPEKYNEYGTNHLKGKDAVTEFICFLLNQKFDMNIRNKQGQTCLHRVVGAQQKGDASKDMIKILTTHGAMQDVQDASGKTLLHVAAYLGREDLINSHLLSHIAVQDKTGNYPHDYAALGGHHTLSRSLLEKLKAHRGTEQALTTRAEQTKAAIIQTATIIAAAATETKPAPAPAVNNDWLLSETEEVARIKVKEALGYKLTETFNFHTRTYIQIVHNLETKADTVIGKSFDDFSDKTLLEDAYHELVRLGGTADEASISRQIIKKDRPAPLS